MLGTVRTCGSTNNGSTTSGTCIRSGLKMRFTLCSLSAAAGITAAVLMLAILAAARPASAADAYSVEHTWKIGGDGGWDYLTVDSPNHLLYIARGNRIQIVDVQTGKLVKEITGLKGTHGVVFDSTGKQGYISDGGDNAVRVFDRKTFELTGRIPTGQNPDGIVVEPATQRIFTFNGRSHDATVIDVATNKVVGTIPLMGKPEFPVADGKGTVWVNNEDKSTIQKIDAKTMKVTGEWSIKPCEGPSGLAIDKEHRRLFSVCDKVMAVSDADAGKVVATVPIGDGPDADGYDAKNHIVFSSNGEGTLSIIEQKSADEYTPLQTLKTMRSARTMALDSATGVAYLVGAQYGPPPAATPANPRPRPTIVPDTFVVLAVGK